MLNEVYRSVADIILETRMLKKIEIRLYEGLMSLDARNARDASVLNAAESFAGFGATQTAGGFILALRGVAKKETEERVRVPQRFADFPWKVAETLAKEVPASRPPPPLGSRARFLASTEPPQKPRKLGTILEAPMFKTRATRQWGAPNVHEHRLVGVCRPGRQVLGTRRDRETETEIERPNCHPYRLVQLARVRSQH